VVAYPTQTAPNTGIWKTLMLSKLRMNAYFRLRQAIGAFLARQGFEFFRRGKRDELQRQRDGLFRLALQNQAGATNPAGVRGIIFSKDRPLQLDGLINSYFALVQNPAPLTVLYRASAPKYAAAYREVIAGQSARPIDWVEEKSFRADLLVALENANAGKIFFLVDDIVFIRGFDMNAFAAADLTCQVPSLRLGLNLDFCYPVRVAQPQPLHQLQADGLVSWRWRDGVLDWGYPTSVDGHLFAQPEILLMARISDYKAPNSFEDALASFGSLFADRTGLCYPQSRLVNIPANKVQTENENIASNVQPDWLLRQWQAGYRLDWAKLENLANRGAHQEVDLPLRSVS
jgi:hypothetical protein